MRTPGPRPARRAGFVAFDRREIEQSIPRRFERQVDRDPGRLALNFGAAQWTYGELDAAANRIAHALIGRLAPGAHPIALLIGQGPELVAAILGVLKSGNFYVPLETWHATEYVASVVGEARAAMIVADATGAALAASAAPAIPVLRLAEPGGAPADSRRPGVDVGADDFACVYYTSGTTGRAKGVVETHRNVLHNVMRYTDSLGLDRDDRLTLLQSPSFSGAVSSMFGALANGATLCPYDVRAQGTAGLGRWLAGERISVWHSVPALFREAMRSARAFPDLRIVRIEGDAMSRLDWELFSSRCAPGSFLVNGLGATECGLVRQFFVPHGTPAADGVVPIGYPVEDMDAAVVDETGARLPDGEVGEIAVRSRYLAKGYWQRADLTARAFVADPVDPELRTYRTGDLGRMRADGCLEHLGRRDARQKIRGQWVDLAEVEAALCNVEGVREAAARVFDDASGDAELVAYVVPSRRAPPNEIALRRRLSARLPAHAVPARFEVIDRLPLNGNGKVDRAALPRPLSSGRQLASVHRAAPTGLEPAIAAIWSEVLGIDPVGVDDAFFDLGGSSLGLCRVQSRLQEQLGIEVPMRALFEHPTVAALARALDQCGAAERKATAVADRRRPEIGATSGLRSRSPLRRVPP